MQDICIFFFYSGVLLLLLIYNVFRKYNRYKLLNERFPHKTIVSSVTTYLSSDVYERFTFWTYKMVFPSHLIMSWPLPDLSCDSGNTGILWRISKTPRWTSRVSFWPSALKLSPRAHSVNWKDSVNVKPASWTSLVSAVLFLKELINPCHIRFLRHAQVPMAKKNLMSRKKRAKLSISPKA